MTDHNLLESDKEPEAEVVVESVEQENQHDAYVGDSGIIRAEFNGAAFNADNHMVMFHGY
jgi:hypothetical protein